MLRRELIVCFSTVSWDYLWQRHHHVMSRFAHAGNRVLYVEPLGVRMVQWRDARRIAARLQNRRRAGKRGVRQVLPNVWVMDPLVNPLQEIEFVHQRNANALTRRVQNAVAQLGGGEPILWTYVPTRLAYDVIARLANKLVVYECVDAMTENVKGVFASFAESEQKLLRRADLVIVTSRALLERQLPFNAATYYVPHGVEYELFANDSLAEPSALAAIPHPRLVFFGTIDERIDFELITRLAARHPDWQIIFMGIVTTDVSALQKFSNLHFLGHVAHAALPAHLRHADVLLMPYRLSVYAQYMNPAKLFECLAAGKPLVARALPVFQEFRAVVDVASDAIEFERLVQRAVEHGADAENIARRRACARANTWDARFAEINAHVETALRALGRMVNSPQP